MWIECVPNVSEGQNQDLINELVQTLENQRRTHVLHVDSGESAHRTVITFMVHEDDFISTGFAFFEKALSLIDMRNHKGVHPRMGAVDVFPVIPLNADEAKSLVKVNQLGEKLSEKLDLPIIFYEKSARKPGFENLAKARRSLEFFRGNPMRKNEWIDLGKDRSIEKTGITALGLRPPLIAFNLNLNTKNRDLAVYIAERLRTSGRMENGHRIPGLFQGLKCIGWYLEDQARAQVSCNIVDHKKLDLFEFYKKASELAAEHGARITGSELIGLMPKAFLLKGNPFQGKEEHRLEKAVEFIGLENRENGLWKNRILEEVIQRKTNLTFDLSNW